MQWLTVDNILTANIFYRHLKLLPILYFLIFNLQADKTNFEIHKPNIIQVINTEKAMPNV